jgi:hypothetical protein
MVMTSLAWPAKADLTTLSRPDFDHNGAESILVKV